MEHQLTESDLSQFSGSTEFYRHAIARRCLYTEGVQFLAERAGAYWLLDLILLHGSRKVDGEDFQTWELTLDAPPKRGAVLITTDGNENVLLRKRIDYTDFPLPSIKLFACRNELGGFTVMLPDEY